MREHAVVKVGDVLLSRGDHHAVVQLKSTEYEAPILEPLRTVGVVWGAVSLSGVLVCAVLHTCCW